MRGNAQSIKEHMWFKGLPWEDLLNKTVKAPFIPKVKPPQRSEIITREIMGYLAKYESQNEFTEKMSEALWDFDF
jgi:hypothetical protein